jgi:hypothetical protein
LIVDAKTSRASVTALIPANQTHLATAVLYFFAADLPIADPSKLDTSTAIASNQAAGHPTRAIVGSSAGVDSAERLRDWWETQSMLAKQSTRLKV